MKTLLTAIAGFAAVCAPSAARAHDFFLMPESFNPPASPHLIVRATVGSTFPTPEIVVPADRAESIVVRGAGNPTIQASAAEEKALPLHVIGARAGVVIAAVKAKAREVEYAEDRIPLILGEYRVAPAAAAEVERLPRPRTWKVNSRRFAKTLLCVQTCTGGADSGQPIDGTLEFVTDANNRDQFILLAGGKPLSNYPVDLVDSEGKRAHLATNAQGLIALPPTVKGPLMLFAAFLTPPTGAERFTLDLTSLTVAR